MPGPDYWQNRADYAIRATLDTKAKAIRGTVRIAYTNNSPDTLDVLWLHLEQNLYKADSRGYMAAGGEPRGTTDGMTLTSAEVAVVKANAGAITPLIRDPPSQLPLPPPLPPGHAAPLPPPYHSSTPPNYARRHT